METSAAGPPTATAIAASTVLRAVRDQAMFMVDPQGRIASWNEGVGLILRWQEDEWVGQPLSVAFTAEDVAAGVPEAEMRKAAATGRADDTRWMQRQGGERFFALGELTRMLADDGRIVGYLKVLRDDSSVHAAAQAREQLDRERQATLAEAQAARAEAERSSRSKDEFLATISHELRTPLAAIVGWAHVLERGVVDPETLQHGLAAISRNARMQVQLIEDLLDMNRIESGQLRVDMQRMDLGGVIAAAIDAAVPAAAAKGIGLRTSFGPEVGAVLGDPARLQQVLGNLLHNAVKFTPAGGQVSVALTQWGGEAQIAVADTGQGIEREFLARVFDRFRQQDATTTRRHGGLGIGLAIVQQLVRLHGGTVRAQSPGPGQGSTFTVTLPLVPPKAAPAAANAAGTPAAVSEEVRARDGGPRLDGVTVLLVDDERDVRAVTRHVLQRAGARVLEAEDASAAMELLQQERPAVILSDIGMPGMDGYAFMRDVRALPPGQGGATPAAAFTAYTREEDRQRAFDAGYQLHMAKPVATEALLQAVQQLAGGLHKRD